ncbi:MAG: FtsX-like permease family protein [Candidatus Egerieousia sp.]
MRFPTFIARRYLFSKKRHNVINIVSVVSACAIGLGTLALIVILSVYNGFDSIISEMYENSSPDFVIVPKAGKSLDTEDSTIVKIHKAASGKGEFTWCPVIEDNAYIQYDMVQTIAHIKGVPDEYTTIRKVTDNIIEGAFELQFGDFKKAIVAESLAAELRLKTTFSTPLEIFYPSRTEDISLLTPWENLMNIRMRPSGVISTLQGDETDLIYIGLDAARELFQYERSECNKIEIFAAEGTVSKRIAESEKFIKKLLKSENADYILKNRYEQNEAVYKMMRTEKIAVYLILFFVIIIVSVNIFASLSMLILEKKSDIKTYKTIGADTPLIRSAFTLHGWMTCIAGALPGLVIGLILCGLQIKFGLIRMAGNFIIDYYPVAIKLSDVFVIIAGVAVIGFIMSYIPTRTIKYLNNEE